MEKIRSHISQKPVIPGHCIQGKELRPQVLQLIQQDYPDFNEQSYLSDEELNQYRKKYLAQLLTQESGELSLMHHEVIDAITHNKILSENIEIPQDEQRTLGQRLADQIATFGGSWIFILSFFFFIMVWIGINVWLLASRAFDPFPFILLNLILSCLAAIQAPIIMMSQNRQEAKDRMRSEHDFKVNLKAELEIRMLHEKIDYLTLQQHQRLLEIQELQTDYLEDIARQLQLDKPKLKKQ